MNSRIFPVIQDPEGLSAVFQHTGCQLVETIKQSYGTQT